MKKYYVAVLIATAITVISCKKESGNSTGNTPPVAHQIAPEGFNFTTSKEVHINVQLLTNNNQPLKGVPVNVYASRHDRTDKSLLTVISGADGSIKATVSIPAYVDTLYIDPAYVGLMRNAKAVINGSSVNGIIGGTDGLSGDVVANNEQDELSAVDASAGRHTNGRMMTTKYNYHSAYDASGRPTNLVSPSDVISSQLLSFINSSLPETRPVPTYHPDFLNSDAETNINLTKAADVWVTFVSEGAGYYNTLGFYTFPTSTPPATQADIDSIHIILPNASLSGSGGTMHSGDKVLLGHYSAGTSIGFVLLQNAWNPSSKVVNTSATKFFTKDYLNTTESNTSMRRHSVLLNDEQDNLLLQGFEDLNRSGGGSDEDFNDLMFYTTFNPADAVATANINPIDTPTDTDGDGVSDVYDKFPTDATRAYIQYYPTETTYGTVSFEDLWPKTGDYDLNDMVVGYRYKYINNGLNKTVEMYADYTVRAIGATFINGFGVQLPVAANKVSSVTGQKLTGGYITMGANGTEAGQTKAVIIPFDDTRSLYASGGFTNVLSTIPYITGDTAHLHIQFTTAQSATELGAGVYNPFIICNQRRGYEVHLPGSKPTDKADATLFGTDQDRTSVANNKYYLSANNWPWAISFTEDFDYPTETDNVSTAYLKFLTWAQSGGTSYTDWYKGLSGYRNSTFIYQK